MARKKEWDDDDGRTIASMSDVGRQNLFIPRAKPNREERKPSIPETEFEQSKKDRPWEQSEQFTKQERRWYAFGALKAALLIAMAFIVGLGLAILIMLLLWS
ncbi:MAG: hypothetical protein J1E05_02570 [Eubacterium sp.]|nr:hypothetical protein [Eubacterium sp.]